MTVVCIMFVSVLADLCVVVSALVVSGMLVAVLDAFCVVVSGTTAPESVAFCKGCCVELGLWL